MSCERLCILIKIIITFAFENGGALVAFKIKSGFGNTTFFPRCRCFHGPFFHLPCQSQSYILLPLREIIASVNSGCKKCKSTVLNLLFFCTTNVILGILLTMSLQQPKQYNSDYTKYHHKEKLQRSKLTLWIIAMHLLNTFLTTIIQCIFFFFVMSTDFYHLRT